MFTVGAELATAPDQYETYQKHFNPVTAEMVTRLEELIDRMLAEAPLPRVFILPGASGSSAAMDMARCMTRTAERRVVALDEVGGLTNPENTALTSTGWATCCSCWPATKTAICPWKRSLATKN